MKKTLLCLLFLFTNCFYAQINPIEHCTGDTSFDLTSQKTLLIGNLNPAETTVSYYVSLADATNNLNAIASPTSYVSSAASKTIYARIDNKGTVTTNYFNLIVSPYLTSTAIIGQISCQNEKGIITVQGIGGKGPYMYSINGGTYSTSNVFPGLVAGIHTISTKDALGCETLTSVVIEPYLPLVATFTKTYVSCNGGRDGSISINATGGQAPYTYSINNSPYQASSAFAGLSAGTYNVIVKDANGCIATIIAIIAEPAPLIATAVVENQTITVTATGGTANYSYSLDSSGGTYQTSTVFTNIASGNHDIYVKDANGCIFSMNVTVDPIAPLINGSKTAIVNLTTGKTLADIVVQGDNIKWYSTSGKSTAKTKQTSKTSAETPLPLTTVLVDNTTYYASQTINGIESTERLAVTVKLGALATNDFVIKDFAYYPNPVKNVLTISNTSNIDEVSLISIKGETLLVKKINGLHSEIDLSNCSKGVYFLKVKAEETEKTVKLIKE